MKIINRTKERVLAENIIFRRSIFELMAGLIPYKTENKYIYDVLKTQRFTKKDAMVFEIDYPEGIHTWFMSFPITVILADDKLRVVEKTKMKPFRFYIPKEKYRYMVELVESKYNWVDVGDKLSFIA